MSNRFIETQGKSSRLAILFLLGAFWLCLERYHGFHHDALLYLMLALYKINPANYQHDLFVAFGSQGQFTLYPSVYAFIIKWMGIDRAAFLMTVLGQGLWFGALLLLVRRFVSGWQAIAGLACIAYFSRYYDPYFLFSYSEPFPTPRPYAEAFSMAALSFGLARRYVAALALHAIAASFHPLMSAYAFSVSCAAFFLDKEISRHLRGVLFFSAAAIGVVLLTARVSVFAGFMQAYDPEWYALISAFVTDTLVRDWDLDSGCRVLYFLSILGIAWWRRLPVFLERVPVLTGVAVVMLLIWLIGNGLFHDQFVTQLQLWRCIWLLQIIALLAQGVLLVHLWQQEVADRWLAALMLAALLRAGYVNVDGGFALLFVLAGLLLRWVVKVIPEAKCLARQPWASLPVLVPIPQLLVNGYKAWLQRAAAVETVGAATWWQVAAWALVFASIFLLVWFLNRQRMLWLRGVGGWLVCFGVFAIGGAACAWSLPYFAVRQELGAGDQALMETLQARIPPGSVVYSSYGLHWTWYLLQRSNYADVEQMSGAVFSKESSFEGYRRLKHLCAAGMPGCKVAGYPQSRGPFDETFWIRHVPAACSDPALDFVVVEGSVAGAEMFHGDSRTLSVWSCTSFRRG